MYVVYRIYGHSKQYLFFCIISIVSSSATEPEDVYGCLYTVILNIIANQNSIIKSLYSVIERSPHNSLAHLVPKQPSQIQLTEVNDSDAIVSCNRKYVYNYYNACYNAWMHAGLAIINFYTIATQ